MSYSGPACVADCHVPYHHRACTSVVWFPIWLPGDKMRAGIHTLACAPTATRTRDLLLRRHFRDAAWQRPMWPNVGSGCSDIGWMWPGIALCSWPLAPSLAPRDMVSSANVRIAPSRHRPADASPISNLTQLSQAATAPGDGSRAVRLPDLQARDVHAGRTLAGRQIS